MKSVITPLIAIRFRPNYSEKVYNLVIKNFINSPILGTVSNQVIQPTVAQVTYQLMNTIR